MDGRILERIWKFTRRMLNGDKRCKNGKVWEDYFFKSGYI